MFQDAHLGLMFCIIVLKLVASIGFWFTIAKMTGCNVSLHCTGTVIWNYNIYNYLLLTFNCFCSVCFSVLFSSNLYLLQ